MTRVCAWCGRQMGQKAGRDEDTYSICPACLRKKLGGSGPAGGDLVNQEKDLMDARMTRGASAPARCPGVLRVKGG